MAIQQEKEHFAGKSEMRSAIAALTSKSKPLLVTALLIGTALFLASGSQAQTTGSATQPSQPNSSTTVAPKPAPDVARKGGPKPAGSSGRTETTPAPDVQPAARGTKPKGRPSSDGDGVTRTETTPDAQPATRGTKPKARPSHGRTAATPLLIGALSAAAVLALVVSSGNDTPTSP